MTNPDVIGSGVPGEFTPIEQLSYEAARAELAEIVSILEQGQMPLDEALRYWERGEALANYCEKQLAGARKRVEEAIEAREKKDAE
ncbi:MAG: exodeoxyribonuclease VII small subunit [Corynebacterium sp.]|nr:exodeoxyribonuclease VII small subunit [Corynebacterium sp.]